MLTTITVLIHSSYIHVKERGFIMKKIIALLMLIALLFTLAGCSNAVKEAEEAIASIKAATTSKERKRV